MTVIDLKNEDPWHRYAREQRAMRENIGADELWDFIEMLGHIGADKLATKYYANNLTSDSLIADLSNNEDDIDVVFTVSRLEAHFFGIKMPYYRIQHLNGEWEGLAITKDELAILCPGIFKPWRRNPSGFFMPRSSESTECSGSPIISNCYLYCYA
jgi:hypothetical protein